MALESGLIVEALNDQHGLNILTSEPAFLRHLRLERSRSERSRQPFVLMLVEPIRRSRDELESNLLQRTASAVVAAIRETDVAGWYKRRCLGVIFAEIGPREKSAVIGALRTRMVTALRSTLRSEEIGQLQLSFYWFPDEWGVGGPGVQTTIPLYADLVQPEKKKRLPLAMKRAIDIIGSALILTALSPVLLAIALAIKLTSPGRVIFRQQRVGQHGVPFTLFKFRSMYVDCDAAPHKEFIKRYIAGGSDAHADVAPNGAVYKLTKDSRVTLVGGFLRKTSLDEFPQLFNVLRGEMSLVGPRPPIPYELEDYAPWHRRRVLEVKPGVTGLWQVTGRSSLRFDDMVRLDLRYARGWSLWLDLKILLRTARVVLSGAGAF